MQIAHGIRAGKDEFQQTICPLSMHIFCLYLMLINDLKYVEWDVKPYYTHTLVLISKAYQFLNL